MERPLCRPRRSSTTSVKRTKGIPGLDIQIAAQENGPPAGKAINLRVEGTNYGDAWTRRSASCATSSRTSSATPLDVEDGRPSPGIDWQITIDRVLAAKYGIGVRELSPYVQLVTSGVKIGTYRPERHDQRTRHPGSAAAGPAHLRRSRHAQDRDGAGPGAGQQLHQADSRPQGRDHRPLQRQFAMTVAANITDAAKAKGVNVADKIKQLQDWRSRRPPQAPGRPTSRSSTAVRTEQMADTFAFLGKAFAAVIFMIFLVLLLEYNSFYQVLVTLTTVDDVARGRDARAAHHST